MFYAKGISKLLDVEGKFNWPLSRHCFYYNFLNDSDTSTIDEESLPSTSSEHEEENVFLNLFNTRTLSLMNWSIHYVGNFSIKQILLSQMKF